MAQGGPSRERPLVEDVPEEVLEPSLGDATPLRVDFLPILERPRVHVQLQRSLIVVRRKAASPAGTAHPGAARTVSRGRHWGLGKGGGGGGGGGCRGGNQGPQGASRGEGILGQHVGRRRQNHGDRGAKRVPADPIGGLSAAVRLIPWVPRDCAINAGPRVWVRRARAHIQAGAGTASPIILIAEVLVLDTCGPLARSAVPWVAAGKAATSPAA